MCDIVLPFVRDVLIPMANFVNEIKGLPEEVEKMKGELRKIQTEIYKADRMGATEEANTEKVKDLLERFFRLEDLLDEYTICEQWKPARDPPCTAFPSEVAGLIINMSLRALMAANIKFLKWQHTSERDDGLLQVTSSSQPDAEVQRFQDAALFLNEADVVGFEIPKKSLIDWLVNGRKERTVVSVVAMGGQGKTTLANQVFKNQQVADSFNIHRAWVTVSETYTVEGVLRDMLKGFYKEQHQPLPERFSKMDRRDLKAEVRTYLHGKRYAVFFDDVWDTPFWDGIDHVLIDDKVGSRVLITTRDQGVADSCQKSSFVQVLYLKPLTKEKSLELFYKKAFFDLDGSCPPNLVKVSSKIVSKCRGLPLAIVAIGGVLAGKERHVSVWKDFSKDLSSELKKESSLDGVKKILGFSYNHLPSHLKPCFLYFGMYPDDYAVESKRLIKQWIAEGFIKKEQNGKPLEKVAEGYLNELIRRSLVQASSFTSDGTVKKCRVHDLLRDLILKKNEDLSFSQFITMEDNANQLAALNGKSRRISIATVDFKELFMMSTKNIRSMFFPKKKTDFPDLMRKIFTNYKLLKVLDFEGLVMEGCGVPENLGTLIHLRYLSFKNTKIKDLPKSIGKLENLETLDLRKTCVRVLPKEMGKLRKLRHLITEYAVNMIAWKDSIGGMTSLQTLSKVSLDVDEAGELIRELEKLTQLRGLGFGNVRDEHRTALCSLLNKMQHIEELSLQAADLVKHNSIMDLDRGAMPMLRVLYFDGTLNDPFISGHENLVRLILNCSQLTVDTFRSLQKMSQLSFLRISYSDYNSDDTSLRVDDGGFPNLKHLSLWEIEGIESLDIERGALPSLQYMDLNCMSGLKEMPKGFQHLKNLQYLTLYDTPGVDVVTDSQQRQIVQHVPRIQVYNDDQYKAIAVVKFGKLLDQDEED